ncbi:PIG-L family deacetylase [Aquihabitans sp. G128]|uniref:PIG-L deacetylase family protein n=1 Tax=Aquihabitans sp. G128 TaxID=2849779 RepID=UPI001C21D17E|nr:PIG-L family deacetylase [Aquihabitans sp. G128]QXC60515.1 PIG-L family deacetylase [Aquihabitans sp. G128]
MNRAAHRPIVLIAPHPDDEVIGAGGLLARLAATGIPVHIVHVTDGELSVAATERRRDQARLAARRLGATGVEFLGFTTRALRHQAGLLDRLIAVIELLHPGVLLIPHEHESDQDHAEVHLAGREAAFSATSTMVSSPAPTIDLILGFEVWSPIRRPALCLPVDGTAAINKAEAAAAYRDEVERLGIGEAAQGLGAYRGRMFAGSTQAEAFTVEHCTVDLPLAVMER